MQLKTNIIKGNYFNGSWFRDEKLKVDTIVNPADLSQVVGHVQWANKTVAKLALESANSALKSWKK